MKYKKLFSLKNSQRGASALEVIFAIGLVVAVTPFIYNQVTEMTHVVHDVSVANQIRSVRDAVLSFMRTNQSEFQNESNEISDENLAAIAPGAIKGMVYQTSIDANGVNKNLEAYLLFNIDDTRYRVSNIAKYIGGDAAAVGDDGRAYAKDWAVQLPAAWSDVLGASDNHLVYRIMRDFGGDDKTLYLHRGDLGDNLNQMQRTLHMGGFDLVNVADFSAKNLYMRMVNTPCINAERPCVNAETVITANQVLFTKGASINGGTLELKSFTGNKAGHFQNINVQSVEGASDAGNICKNSEEGRCQIGTADLTSSSFNLNRSDGLRMFGDNTSAEVHINGFDLSGDLRANTITADEISAPHSDNLGSVTFFVSNESSVLGGAFMLQLGLDSSAVKWVYVNKARNAERTNELPQGPELKEIKIKTATSGNQHLEQNENLSPLNLSSTEIDKVLSSANMAYPGQ